MTRKSLRWIAMGLALSAATGCAHHYAEFSAPHDRPFPLGAVSDSHWETMQTNAEAADFVFYDHEFVGETAELAPGAKRHLEQVALRLEHTPFPVVIEQSQHAENGRLDRERREAVVGHLARMGLPNIDERVVVAPAFAEGFTAVEGERAYSNIISGNSQSFGRRFGGFGGAYR